jgi:hypothetical protein
MTDSFSSTTAPAPDEDPRGGLPPAGELFSSAEAKLVWGALQTLGEADLRLVFDRLQQHVLVPEVSKGTHAQKVARAIGALREASDIARLEQGAASLADVELRQDTYVRLRSLQPDRGWPPATSVKRWMAEAGTTRCGWRRFSRCSTATRSCTRWALSSRARS